MAFSAYAARTPSSVDHLFTSFFPRYVMTRDVRAHDALWHSAKTNRQKDDVSVAILGAYPRQVVFRLGPCRAPGAVHVLVVDPDEHIASDPFHAQTT